VRTRGAPYTPPSSVVANADVGAGVGAKLMVAVNCKIYALSSYGIFQVICLESHFHVHELEDSKLISLFRPGAVHSLFATQLEYEES
jgi:hypothetical protein